MSKSFTTHNSILHILHGENTTASRHRLIELTSQAKFQNTEVLSFNGKKTSPQEIRQALDTPSLFGHHRLIVIEQLHSRPKSRDQSAIFELLNQKDSPTPTILWESKSLTPAQLKKFPKAQVENFKFETFIWKFLDQLAPHNSHTLLRFFRNSLTTHPPELLFTLIVKRFRLLIAAQDHQAQILSDLGTRSAWQQKIISNQSKKFPLAQLMPRYQQLLTIDSSTKTGSALLPLQTQLEQFLVNL